MAENAYDDYGGVDIQGKIGRMLNVREVSPGLVRLTITPYMNEITIVVPLANLMEAIAHITKPKA
jgi:hypothetical protein